MPSLLFEVNSSVAPSRTSDSQASFWWLSRRSEGPSTAKTSAGSVSEAARTASRPSGPAEKEETTRLPLTMRSTGPPATLTRARCSLRSSTTRKRTAAPSFVKTGEEAGRSRSGQSARGAPPAAGTTMSRSWP